MTREELREHCEKQIRGCEYFARERGTEPSGKVYEESKLILELLEQDSILDKIKDEIENMEIVYDKSPNYEDDRTDKEKAVDWFNMDKFLFLQIIDKYREESEDIE